MPEAGGFDYWYRGELPGLAPDGLDCGGFDYWYVGELTPSYSPAAPPAQDDLTADSLTGGTPILGEPSIGQVHALGTTSIDTGTPDLTQSQLGQEHGLTADELTVGVPTLAEPTLAEEGIVLSAEQIEDFIRLIWTG